MHVLNRVRVGTRLAWGFGLVLLLMAVMIFIGLGQMSQQQSSLEQLIEESQGRIALVNTMRDAVRFQATALRDVVAQEDLSFKKAELKLMREARKRYKEASEALAARMTDAASQERFAAIRNQEEAAANAVSQVMEATLTEEHAAAQAGIRDGVRPRQLELITALDKLQTELESQSLAAVEQATGSYHTARLLLFTLGASALVVGTGIGWLITRSIITPLKEAVQLASRIAAGDLTARLEIRGDDELARLQGSLDDMVGHLASLISQAADAARQVTEAAQDLSATASHGATQAEQTNDQVLEVAMAMELMSVSIDRVAQGARNVVEAASQTHQVAGEGNDNVQRGTQAIDGVVRSMSSYGEAIQALSGQVQEISDITRVIREIAEQTNLLALNAAIEAARAGEAGRGFAVVADEVRKLAERTASSTQSITQTVDSIGQKTGSVVSAMREVAAEVERSVTLNQQTHVLLGEILGAAEQVVDEARSIATTSGEQKEASGRTTRAVERITKLASREASSMQDINLAAEQMRNASSLLQQVVSRFKV